MRRSAILAVMCVGAMLTGCGRVDPVDSRSVPAETTAAVENKTEVTTSAADVTTGAASTSATTTASTKSTTKTTTTATKSVAHGGTTLTVAKRTGTSNKTTTQRTNATTSQTTTATTTTAVTTTLPVPIHKVFSKDSLSCRVTNEGIDITVDDSKLQTIEIDTEELIAALSDIKTEMKASIIIEDVDLDGHDDLFIPQQVGTLNTFGVYYHYDAEEEKFVKWEELKEVDSRASVSEEDKTFTTEVKLSEDEYEIKMFAWNGTEPAIQTMKKKYRSAEDKDELLIDYFEYTGGEEKLVKRERVLFDAEGREAGAEEVELG